MSDYDLSDSIQSSHHFQRRHTEEEPGYQDSSGEYRYKYWPPYDNGQGDPEVHSHGWHNPSPRTFYGRATSPRYRQSSEFNAHSIKQLDAATLQGSDLHFRPRFPSSSSRQRPSYPSNSNYGSFRNSSPRGFRGTPRNRYPGYNRGQFSRPSFNSRPNFDGSSSGGYYNSRGNRSFNPYYRGGRGGFRWRGNRGRGRGGGENSGAYGFYYSSGTSYYDDKGRYHAGDGAEHEGMGGGSEQANRSSTDSRNSTSSSGQEDNHQPKEKKDMIPLEVAEMLRGREKQLHGTVFSWSVREEASRFSMHLFWSPKERTEHDHGYHQQQQQPQDYYPSQNYHYQQQQEQQPAHASHQRYLERPTAAYSEKSLSVSGGSGGSMGTEATCRNQELAKSRSDDLLKVKASDTSRRLQKTNKIAEDVALRQKQKNLHHIFQEKLLQQMAESQRSEFAAKLKALQKDQNEVSTNNETGTEEIQGNDVTMRSNQNHLDSRYEPGSDDVKEKNEKLVAFLERKNGVMSILQRMVENKEKLGDAGKVQKSENPSGEWSGNIPNQCPVDFSQLFPVRKVDDPNNPTPANLQQTYREAWIERCQKLQNLQQSHAPPFLGSEKCGGDRPEWGNQDMPMSSNTSMAGQTPPFLLWNIFPNDPDSYIPMLPFGDIVNPFQDQMEHPFASYPIGVKLWHSGRDWEKLRPEPSLIPIPVDMSHHRKRGETGWVVGAGPRRSPHVHPPAWNVA